MIDFFIFDNNKFINRKKFLKKIIEEIFGIKNIKIDKILNIIYTIIKTKLIKPIYLARFI